ncbi:MauE/DoxX family redox-associated membrane protein [Micromonospora zamorensis]|uniref:MauE/DoxX family redox-associated membrane protein n=1 Tax=Micromonospora zamorensis TaxID=709883 RepID=UPI003D989621
MITLTVITATFTVAGALLLAVAGIAHLSHPGRLHAVLTRQRLFPAWSMKMVVAGLTVTELGVAGLVVTTMVVGGPSVVVAALTQAALFAALAVYAGLLRLLAPGVACGCTSGDEPASFVVVASNVAIAVASAGSALLMNQDTNAVNAATRAMIFAAAFAVAVVLPILNNGARPLQEAR